jgi:hypothetical protein
MVYEELIQLYCAMVHGHHKPFWDCDRNRGAMLFVSKLIHEEFLTVLCRHSWTSILLMDDRVPSPLSLLRSLRLHPVMISSIRALELYINCVVSGRTLRWAGEVDSVLTLLARFTTLQELELNIGSFSCRDDIDLAFDTIVDFVRNLPAMTSFRVRLFCARIGTGAKRRIEKKILVDGRHTWCPVSSFVGSLIGRFNYPQMVFRRCFFVDGVVS